MILLILSVFFFAEYAFTAPCSTPSCPYTQDCVLPLCQLDSDNKGFTWNYVLAGISPQRRTEFWVGEEVSVPVECCDCIVGESYSATDHENVENVFSQLIKAYIDKYGSSKKQIDNNTNTQINSTMNDSYIGTIEIINNNNDYNSVLNINSQNNLMKFILKRIRNVQVHVNV